MGFAHKKQETLIPFAIISANATPRRRGNKWQRIKTMVGLQLSVPSPRGRELGRGLQQSNPPDIPRPARRKVVACALPTKTENLIPFAIISTNAIREQNPRYFQTTFRIKRSSETRKPALLTFRIQIERTVWYDRQVLAVEVGISFLRIEVFEQLRINRFGHKLN